MKIELTPEQEALREAVQQFATEQLLPKAGAHDRDERMAPETIQQIAAQGYLGSLIPTAHGGTGWDMLSVGLLCEAFGAACTNSRNLLTVHGMAALALSRLGTAEQKARWLPALSSGQTIGAFALSEPDVGSDAKSVQSTATPTEGGYLLNGGKKWITFGMVAGLFLVIAQCEGKPTAFLVEADRPGFLRQPISGLLGHRGSMIAELTFENCLIPAANLVGQVGAGLRMVALHCLDYGRYSIAWGCVGLAQACLEEAVTYGRNRRQFDRPIIENQLIQQMVTEMAVGVKAARLLCYNAGYLHDISDPEAIMETWNAKYFASRTATMAAGHAVQILGANGCSNQYRVERFYRDAKIHEIIEGSTQVHEMLIARHVTNTL